MLTINEYRKVESLEEAYELNQKKNNKIIAGGVWMKKNFQRFLVPTAVTVWRDVRKRSVSRIFLESTTWAYSLE